MRPVKRAVNPSYRDKKRAGKEAMLNSSDIPIITPDNPIIDKPALDPVELNQTTNNDIVAVSGKVKKSKAGNKREKPLNNRYLEFCRLIVQCNLKPGESYRSLWKDCTDESATAQACRLLRDSRITKELERLRKEVEILTAQQKLDSIECRHGKALAVLDDLMVNAKSESVRANVAMEAILDRTVPKKTINVSTNIKIDSKDIARLRDVYLKDRKQVIVKEITTNAEVVKTDESVVEQGETGVDLQ